MTLLFFFVKEINFCTIPLFELKQRVVVYFAINSFLTVTMQVTVVRDRTLK